MTMDHFAECLWPHAWAGADTKERERLCTIVSEGVRRMNERGYAIVPREPTRAMIGIGAEVSNQGVVATYTAMLTAGEVKP